MVTVEVPISFLLRDELCGCKECRQLENERMQASSKYERSTAAETMFEGEERKKKTDR